MEDSINGFNKPCLPKNIAPIIKTLSVKENYKKIENLTAINIVTLLIFLIRFDISTGVDYHGLTINYI